MKVYILEHVRELDDSEEIKRVGVYASLEDAEQARERSGLLPGFRDHPDGFHISEYEVGRDHWTSGFTTVEGGASTATRPADPRAA